MNDTSVFELNEDMPLYVICPHCGGGVEIAKINCKIFRHGILIKNGKQINPHLSKLECDKLVAANQIYGCGKPFELVYTNVDHLLNTTELTEPTEPSCKKQLHAVICNYI